MQVDKDLEVVRPLPRPYWRVLVFDPRKGEVVDETKWMGRERAEVLAIQSNWVWPNIQFILQQKVC